MKVGRELIDMITFKAKKIKYYCPTSWSEVTFKQWKELNKTKNDLKIISILTGIPKRTIERISENSILKLSLAIGFIAKPISIEDYNPPEKIVINEQLSIPYVKNISEKTFGQKIYLQHTIQENQDNEQILIPEVVLVYGQPYIDKTDFDLNRLIELKNSLDNVFFVDLYSAVIGYSQQLKTIVETEKKELKIETTNEQKSAGVEMFSKFGVMNTVKALANNDVLNYEKVLQIEYNTVFIHLLMNKTEGIYQENYRKILEQKHKRK